VLEDIRSQNKVFGEQLSAIRDQVDKIDQKLDLHTEMLRGLINEKGHRNIEG